MSSKAIFMADCHLGVSTGRESKLSDIIWGLTASAKFANANGIDTIFILGDLFHDRRSIGIDVLCAAYDFFETAKNEYGLNYITFPGNHDMFLKHSWEINSVKPMQQVITVVNDVKLVTVDDRRFWILPFVHNEAAFMDILHKIEEQYEEDDVLLTHIGIRGSELNVCFLLKDWSFVDFSESKFQQVYTGHFHIPQQVNHNVWYPGSLIPFKFDEGNCSHGFLVYDLKTRKHEHIDIWECGAEHLGDDIKPPPNFLTMPDADLDKITPKLIKHNILRIAPSRDYTKNEKQEIGQALLELGARDVRWMELRRDDDNKPLAQTAQMKMANTPKEVFKLIIQNDTKEIEKQGLQTALLYQIVDDVIKEGDERYVTNLSEE